MKTYYWRCRRKGPTPAVGNGEVRDFTICPWDCAPIWKEDGYGGYVLVRKAECEDCNITLKAEEVEQSV
jgi:hypothetical protein